ncbi:MAG: 4-alpha-glucanotransferase [Hyphomicrobiales bacterium]|nr:4-alpha-glucanotransferase [Hyphomicrobiales bacterium]
MTAGHPLHRLAARVGIDRDFVAKAGDTVTVSDTVLRAVLEAMDVPAGTDAEIAASLDRARPTPDAALSAPPGVACYVPDWLEDGRCWGIACQLYSLRSERNWGIGDFEDLGRLAEVAAAAGADFLGVNPLHALFLAAPQRCSPFFPSSRRFLNSLYIAVDKVPGANALGERLEPPEKIRAGHLIDYVKVGEAKRKALGLLYSSFEDGGSAAEKAEVAEFAAEQGRALFLHALFEALSEEMVERGHGATWHNWPDEFRDSDSDAVRAFAASNVGDVAFHSWLQWVADRQLAAAHARALAAGMRIGLYLDLAVGVAPDGSETWASRDLVVSGIRIGAPPDYFNAAGQDWGLAPLSPSGLVAHDFDPYRLMLDSALRHAGALRIDHVMSIYRLYWIAEGFTAADGVYVHYPFQAMLRTLADVSMHHRTIVIGEDLGIVPPGFREVLRAAEMQSYRVLFFEKADDMFQQPEAYPCEGLACITIHDLHTLAGWWQGRDVVVLDAAGVLQDHDLGQLFEQRAHERRRLLGLLWEKGLLPEGMVSVLHDQIDPPADLPLDVAVALHRLIARTPCRLVAVAAEDLTGATEQVNVPGTTHEHPNWQRRLDVPIEQLTAHPLFDAITNAMRDERPKSP